MGKANRPQSCPVNPASWEDRGVGSGLWVDDQCDQPYCRVPGCGDEWLWEFSWPGGWGSGWVRPGRGDLACAWLRHPRPRRPRTGRRWGSWGPPAGGHHHRGAQWLGHHRGRGGSDVNLSVTLDTEIMKCCKYSWNGAVFSVLPLSRERSRITLIINYFLSFLIIWQPT